MRVTVESTGHMKDKVTSYGTRSVLHGHIMLCDDQVDRLRILLESLCPTYGIINDSFAFGLGDGYCTNVFGLKAPQLLITIDASRRP